MNITLADLRAANLARQEEWCPDQKPDLSFRGNELAGEVGEACNQIKKLERARHGWRGSKGSLDALGDELADVVICADLTAICAGIDLHAKIIAKFNATSDANGLSTRLQVAEKPIDDDAAVKQGMVLAASIIMQAWGRDEYAQEILGAAGIKTEQDILAIGLGDYDINLLRLLLENDATISGRDGRD